MSKMLLVWENIPESTDLYELGARTEVADWAEASAGMYINSGDIPDDHPINRLQTWLDTDEGKKAKLNGAFATGPYDYVVVCGFAM